MQISRKAVIIFLGVSVFLTTVSLTILALTVKEQVTSTTEAKDQIAGVGDEDTGLRKIIKEAIDEPKRTDLLLPDLSIKAPIQLYIAGSLTSKQLRFNTTFVNLGPGALEVLGHADPESGVTHAAQYIFAAGAPGEYRDIGSFELHPTHNHWHIADHVIYQLWSLDESGVKKKIVADTGKMSFCLWDEHVNDLTITNAPQSRVYGFTCNRNTQGMSVGWADTYLARVDGQELDITNLPDGEYVLRFDVNPDRKIFETTYDNNYGELKVRIEGFKVTVL